MIYILCSGEWVNAGQRQPVIQLISKAKIDKNSFYLTADFLLYEILKLLFPPYFVNN